MKRALVTGGSSGIGQAVASMFKELKWQVIVLDKDAPKNDTDTFYQVDIQNGKDIENIFANVGSLDAVVHCAGVYNNTPLDKSDVDEIARICRTNLEGTAYVNRAAIKNMKSSGGVIINISSALALVPEPDSAMYCATKAGIVHLTRALAQAYAPKIRVNAVLPGPVDTPMLRNAFSTNEELEAYKNLNPLKRFAKPEEIAHAVRFLVENKYTTGTLLQVDGGEGSTSIYSRDLQE
jgi:NAD(P)-dependent dehydrogenase (short-subunit alcohol dehydrogenase family)